MSRRPAFAPAPDSASLGRELRAVAAHNRLVESDWCWRQHRSSQTPAASEPEAGAAPVNTPESLLAARREAEARKLAARSGAPSHDAPPSPNDDGEDEGKSKRKRKHGEKKRKKEKDKKEKKKKKRRRADDEARVDQEGGRGRRKKRRRADGAAKSSSSSGDSSCGHD